MDEQSPSPGRFLPSGVRRVRYFTGLLLSADDFEAEQEYLLGRQRLLLRLLIGSGVVTGLEVTLESASTVVVSAGVAIDAMGHVIEVTRPHLVDVTSCAQGMTQRLALRYAERAAHPVPAPNGLQASRWDEGAEVVLVESKPDDDLVTVAEITAGFGGELYVTDCRRLVGTV